MTGVETFNERIGRAIRAARQEALVKQSELGRRLSPPLDRSTISNYEAGRRAVPIDVLCDIARVLGVSVTSLVPEDVPEDGAITKIRQVLTDRPDLTPQVLEFLDLLTDDGSSAG